MRNILFILLTVVLFGCSSDDENPLIGTWQRVEESGTEYIMIFNKDLTLRTITKINGEIVSDKTETYRIDGNNIIFEKTSSYYFKIINQDGNTYFRLMYKSPDNDLYMEFKKI